MKHLPVPPQSKFYTPEIEEEGVTIFRGDVKQVVAWGKLAERENDVLRAFLWDDELQQLTVTSANLGISLTYRKRYVQRQAAGTRVEQGRLIIVKPQGLKP